MSEIRPVDGEEVIELTVGEDASGVRVDAYMRTDDVSFALADCVAHRSGCTAH